MEAILFEYRWGALVNLYSTIKPFPDIFERSSYDLRGIEDGLTVEIVSEKKNKYKL